MTGRGQGAGLLLPRTWGPQWIWDEGWWWLRVPARTEPTPAPRAGLLPAQALLEGTPSQPQPTWGPGHPAGACLLSSSLSGLIALGPP